MSRKVLIVDDEADIRELIVLTLTRLGLDIDAAASVGEAKRFLGKHEYELALTDMRLPDGTGLDLVRYIGENHGNTPVAVITAYGSAENAVAALKAGAFDYVAKPIKLEQLRSLVQQALKMPGRGQSDRKPGSGPRLLGDSPPIQRARELIDRVARSQAPVFVTGESGTGKEVAARLIHNGSSRREGPFVAVNCGAIPENLMESEFFGYRKGAFTGADADREGFFQVARGGTLFLDEVGDLPLAMQVKLLRVIQEKRVRKVGDTAEDPVDVRIISATHKDLAGKVADGTFRQDLFYRLNVIELRMPSLREIPEDVPLIADAVLARISEQSKLPVPMLTQEAVAALKRHDFPGNVRELENILERAVALAGGDRIEPDDLYLRTSPEMEAAEVQAMTPAPAGLIDVPLHEYLDKVERDAIMKALEATRFNRTQAAKLLGITFRSLRYRLDRLGIE